MLSNGMKESTEAVVTLKIGEYEEAAFMDMMDYIKSNTLPSRNDKNPLELLELLTIADKFDVSSCTKSCIDSLLSLPMDTELALLFFDLPKSISKSGPFRILTDHAKMFFTKTLKDFKGFPEDIGEVSQDVIKMVLSRHDLCLESEDEAYDFLMKWVTSHFSDLEGRREFLHSRVLKLIRFPYVSSSKLSSFYECPYVEDDFKAEIQLELKKLEYVKRLYTYLPVMVEEPESGRYKVFLELDRKDCSNLAKLGGQCTNTFVVGGQEFYLAMKCRYNKDKKPSTLGIRLHTTKSRGLTLIRFEIAYEKKKKKKKNPSEALTKACQETVLNRRKTSVGFNHLFGAEWDALLDTKSDFFIDGTLLLRAGIQIKVNT